MSGLFLLAPVLNLVTSVDRFATNVTMSESTPLKIVIVAACACLGLASLGFGSWTIAKRRSAAQFHSNLAFVLSCAVALVALEGVARLSIANGWAPLNNERLYSNRLCSEDYWRMRAARIDLGIEPDRYHSILGWTASRTSDDPDRMDPGPDADPRPKVLFYGDSFMAGISREHGTIPRLLQSQFPDFQMLNYGVGGYGVDQIWLRYKLSGEKYPAELVVLGVLTHDLSRSLLKIRDYRKPYFEKRPDGTFALSGVPIEKELSAWLEENGPELRSYSIGALKTAANLLWYGFESSNVRCNEESSRSRNTAILTMATEHAEALEHQVVGLVFVSAREMFLKAGSAISCAIIFRRGRSQLLDTKEVILMAAESHGHAILDYFVANDGHPNALGNRVIAEALARLIVERDMLLTQADN